MTKPLPVGERSEDEDKCATVDLDEAPRTEGDSNFVATKRGCVIELSR